MRKGGGIEFPPLSIRYECVRGLLNCYTSSRFFAQMPMFADAVIAQTSLGLLIPAKILPPPRGVASRSRATIHANGQPNVPLSVNCKFRRVSRNPLHDHPRAPRPPTHAPHPPSRWIAASGPTITVLMSRCRRESHDR